MQILSTIDLLINSKIRNNLHSIQTRKQSGMPYYCTFFKVVCRPASIYCSLITISILILSWNAMHDFLCSLRRSNHDPELRVLRSFSKPVTRNKGVKYPQNSKHLGWKVWDILPSTNFYTPPNPWIIWTCRSMLASQSAVASGSNLASVVIRTNRWRLLRSSSGQCTCQKIACREDWSEHLNLSSGIWSK